MNPLVSIIIPTYNRSHLLGATIDSVLSQTYSNWECIIVDDGSTDHTQELMEFYLKSDERIKLYYRPSSRKKGANACRNYGLELSKGIYIQLFDSDDLMVPEFLEKKINKIEENEVDYVISKTANFKDPNPEHVLSKNEKYYQFHRFQLTHINYVTQRINWLSPDFLGKREICLKARFNENLHSSQERNYFSKLTCFSVNATVIDEYLTKRRVHRNTTQALLRQDNLRRKKEELHFFFETWKEISCLKPGSNTEFFLISKVVNFNERILPNIHIQKEILKELLKQKRLKYAFFLFTFKYLFHWTGRGYFLRNYLVQEIT